MAADGTTTNSAERERWNNDRWTDAWQDREVLTLGATPILLEALALRSGERVLDVGSGGGGSAIAAAKAVGPEGSVVGADVSEALTELARRRAADSGASNAVFVTADVQTAVVPGAPFDVATSQFGVMFFDEPVVAFANIRTHLRPGGRLVFACWAAAEHNPWHALITLGQFVPAPPEPAPGKSPTGPFTMGDPVRTEAILTAAGFVNVHHERYDTVAEGPGSAVYDQTLLEFLGVHPGDVGAAHAAVKQHLSQFSIGPERYRFPLSLLIFSALNP